jgi:hypothetical protein
MKFETAVAGEWVQPRKRGYKMMCCDCGLVHVMDFRHVIRGAGNRAIETKGGKIQFRVWMDNRSTAVARRWKIKKGELTVTVTKP